LLDRNTRGHFGWLDDCLGCFCHDNRIGPPGSPRNRTHLRLKVPLDRVDRSEKGVIGLGLANTIQHKSNSTDIQPLQRRSRVTNLCPRGYARLDHHNGAIGKPGKVLSLR
jgi:hypothetical protein